MTQTSRDGHGQPEHHDDSRYARAKDAAADAVETSPLAILAGGIALGAIVGALIPRTDREKELLAPVGRQLSQRASAAVEAAREAGKAEFAELGLTKGAAQDQVKSLLKGVAQAVTTAGSAAAKGASAKA